MEENASMRSMCIEFVRGNQYLWQQGNQLYDQRSGTVGGAGGDQNRHRVRQTRNYIKPIVDEKVSAATSRVPAYEVLAATTDHEDYAAAALASKIALAGYTAWGLRQAVKDAVWYAVVADEGFLYPYWDGTIGPFIEETETSVDPETGEEIEIPTGRSVGVGDIKCRTFGGNEAYWEPGARFEDSRWHAFENARPIKALMDEEGYIGGKNLKADAKQRGVTEGQNSKNTGGSELVIVTEYFERPCKQYPEGRHMTIANEQLIFPPADFPLRDETGAVVDEPPFLRLAYTVDPDSDRDQGIVRHLLDAQRSLNDGENKIHEWIRLALQPQLLAAAGSITTPVTDAPGAIMEYDIIAGMAPPSWRPTPPIPGELFELRQRAENDMRAIAHANDMPASSITSGQEANALIEQQALSWSSFLADLADVHGALMRRCLTLVQRYYTEERTMRYRGRVSWEDTGDFRGADIKGQTDVRVNVNSIEPRTRRSNEQKITNLAQMFPGYFTPEVIMSAMDGGNAEKLIDTYELDVARVAGVIKKIRAGTLMDEPPRPVFPNEEFPNPEAVPLVDEMGQPIGQFVNAETGEPESQFLMEVPSWMPRPFDGVPVHKATMEDWMKSSDYEQLEEDQKEQAHTYYAALLDLEARAQQRAAEQQAAEAEALGAENATRPPSSQMGSMPAVPE